MNEQKSLLVMVGDTYRHRDVLKKAGWQWSPERQRWYQWLMPAHAEMVRSGDKHFTEQSLMLKRRGCMVSLDGVEVWRSKEYGVAAVSEAKAYDLAWDCDSRGNRVALVRIPGSAPDDFM